MKKVVFMKELDFQFVDKKWPFIFRNCAGIRILTLDCKKLLRFVL